MCTVCLTVKYFNTITFTDVTIVKRLTFVMIQSWHSANVEVTIIEIVLNKTSYDYVTIKFFPIIGKLF